MKYSQVLGEDTTIQQEYRYLIEQLRGNSYARIPNNEGIEIFNYNDKLGLHFFCTREQSSKSQSTFLFQIFFTFNSVLWSKSWLNFLQGTR